MEKEAQFDLDAECNFQGLSDEEIETACKYEYMRESQALRDGVKNSRDDSKGTPLRQQHLPSFVQESRGAMYRLVFALRKAGFPKPWKTLREDAQKELFKAISKWENESYPPLVIEDAVPERDLERERAQLAARFPMWRFKPSEPKLLRHWEQSQREYFFGFIRIDKAYNETAACEAFKTWFAKRYARRKEGNPHFDGKLRQLAAMRVRHHYPRSERRAILLSLTSKKTYQRGINETEPDTGKMDVGLSRDCREARKFFQTLFLGQQPISFSSLR